ncbi:MAG: atpC [Verrucomicrobiales bacterium]|nr:atpC [Verrucomicrobiales bacterium]
MLLEIVTPEGKAFSDDVSGVVLPGTLGEMGILPHHAALVSTLNAGELRYTKDSKTHELAIGSGFAEITGDHVNVLTDMAIRDSDIDEAAVQAALDRAQSRLKEDVLPEEIAAVEAAIANSIAQLHLKRKRRTV